MFWDFYTFIDRTAGDEKGKGRRETERERGGGQHAAETGQGLVAARIQSFCTWGSTK